MLRILAVVIERWAVYKAGFQSARDGWQDSRGFARHA
jgi:hypothetical protein